MTILEAPYTDNATDQSPPSPPLSSEEIHNTRSSLISSAQYPIPQPLSSILRAVLNGTGEESVPETKGSESTSSSFRAEKKTSLEWNQNFKFVKEAMEDSLENLIRNCFVAVDDMYFAMPPSERNKPTFQHRLCIRIECSASNKTLSITDLGSGMTRADLINSLGVGRLHPTALIAGRFLSRLDADREKKGAGSFTDDESTNDHSEGVESFSESDDESSNNSYEDDDDKSGSDNSGDAPEKAPSLNRKRLNNSHLSLEPIEVPCTAEGIGGFYAALCSLGVAVQVGTKSKFDDYYEFEVGNHSLKNQKSSISINIDQGKVPRKNCPKANFTHFSISRPMEEGVKPSVSNGFHEFSDVRGESGTRVTLTLSDAAVAAGFLDEEKVLKPLLEKFLEKSPYSVAFSSCCTKKERQDIIDASLKEEESKLAAENDDGIEDDLESDCNPSTYGDTSGIYPKAGSHNSVKERSKFIPLRLSMGERKMLRLVEATMICCDYTTQVDKPFKSAARRTHAQLKGVSSVLRGMVTACDYSAGQKLLEQDNYCDYERFFRQMFEIARRHKIMNPEKMRTEYGKLIYLLQDAVSPSVQPHLSFSCKGPIETVYKFLEERKGLALLEDNLIDVATREILAEKKSRHQISAEIKRKEKAVAILKQNYKNSMLSSDDIHLCLYSICDNDSFLNSNRVPIDKIIFYLKTFFSPGKIEDGYSLSIISGQDGARLSHSHDRQFFFALQSLTLWRDIIDDMFRLWAMAEEDLLSESVTYVLKDTGQGMQRVQQSPRTYKSMQQILTRVQGKVSQWIGSSVIHLGDHNVPNALTFIDKYTQVPRILGPIVICLENLERIYEEDDGIKNFVQSGFGGLERLKKDILYDFFKSAFDGSGADNFYDAGSCIDGRLTSAWNWCSQLPTKPFYCIFKLTGFTGFDGEFK